MDITANQRDYSIIANEYHLDITANQRDYFIVANPPKTDDTAREYLAEYERVTTDGDERVISTGETRVIYATESAYPYEITANQRNYVIIANEVNNG